jgi:hypothetical protein
VLAILIAFCVASPLRAQVDFEKQIRPILEGTCMKCHGPEKPKGKFSLHTREALLAGAEGKAVVPGDPEKSDVIYLITLPPDDPDIMPAEGEPLTKEQVELVTLWIKEGAKWPEGLVLVGPKQDPAGKPDPLNTPGLPVTDAEKSAVSQAEQKGALAMRLAQNTNWLRVDFSLHGKEIKDGDLAIVKSMPNLVDLDLGGTEVTDAGLAHLKDAENLHRLHLEKTKVTSKGLESLAGLQKLSYLNLYGTEVDDAAIDTLAKLKGLEKLYLWQTKVTPDAAKKLREALPEVVINLGWETVLGPKIEPQPQPEPEPAAAVDPNAPKFAIADIMKAHKDGLHKKAIEGGASKEEIVQLVAFYSELVKHEPPKGEPESWKQKTTALLDAAKLLEAGDEKGKAALTAATNCKACHSMHKP